MIPSPVALARALVWNPARPTSIAALINPESLAREFRETVRAIFPDRVAEIMDTPVGPEGRETAQVWAFCHMVEADYFPVYEAEEYEGLLYQIPFVRQGWDWDDFHEVEFRREHEVLFALCQNPYLDDGTRLPFLEGLAGRWPQGVLDRIPADGYSPRRLHAAVDGTRYAAAAEYIDWLWAQTDNPFLDFGQEIEVYDAEWSRENVEFFAGKWREAEAVFQRIDELGNWLVQDIGARMGPLLDVIEATPEPEEGQGEGGYQGHEQQEVTGEPVAA